MLKWLLAREKRLARLLGELVSIESSSFDSAGVNRVVTRLSAEWKKRGARINRVRPAMSAGRGDVLRCEMPAGSRFPGRILVLGHTDTVYERGTLARMPFRVSGGRAYGPGTLDMKAGLVIALAAVDALRALDLTPRHRLVFLWTPDEEVGSEVSRAAIEREARRSEAVLVLEPGTGTCGRLKTARKGVGEFTLEVTGRAAHAGVNPQDGVNAVHELVLQIARVARFGNPRLGITVNADVIEGGTRTNVIAEHARARVDVRCARGRDIARLEKRFRGLRPILPGARLHVIGGIDRPPMERRTAARLFGVAQTLGREMGSRNPPPAGAPMEISPRRWACRRSTVWAPQARERTRPASISARARCLNAPPYWAHCSIHSDAGWYWAGRRRKERRVLSNLYPAGFASLRLFPALSRTYRRGFWFTHCPYYDGSAWVGMRRRELMTIIHKKWLPAAALVGALCLVGAGFATAKYVSHRSAATDPNASNSNPTATLPAEPDAARLTVPAGTAIRVQLDQSLDSGRNQAGDVFDAHTVEPVLVANQVAIPASTPVRGEVVADRRSGHFSHPGILEVRLTQMELNGTWQEISTHEDSRKGGSHTKNNAAWIGGGAGGGALIGAIAGGGKGALIGGPVGAGAGLAAAFFTGKRNVHVPAESQLVFHLAQPLSVTPQG
jgi:glutamate carboxypeptidase